MNRLALVSVLLFFASPAIAQPLMGAYIDDEPGNPNNTLADGHILITGAMSFDLVVTAGGVNPDFFTYEFQITPLEELAPGITKTGESLFHGTVDLGNTPGEYIIAMGSCVEPGSTVELLRVSYTVTDGAIPLQTVVSLAGADPSLYGGAPGVSKCDGTKVAAAFPANGGTDPCGNAYPAGGLILNGCIPDPVDGASFSVLKTRY